MNDVILKHTQLFKHDPDNGTWGDCWRTCVACILMVPVEDVPHVFDKGRDPADAHNDMKAFLRSRGIITITSNFMAEGMDLEGFLFLMKSWTDGQPYIIVGRSSNNTNHVVVCRHDQIIHDPSIDQSGIVGPNETDGRLYWTADVLARPIHRGNL